jgi:hypothetical protein
MPKGRFAKNIIGQVFGDFIVLSKSNTKRDPGGDYVAMWLCKCQSCGLEKEIRSKNLKRTDRIRTCDCHLKQKMSENGKKCRKGSKNISGAYWFSLKRDAKKRGFEFLISIDYGQLLLEKQNFKCSLTGIPIVRELSNSPWLRQGENTASLDRIDSSKGYIEDNVQWVHKDINFMKSNLKQEDFINWCKLVANQAVEVCRIGGECGS